MQEINIEEKKSLSLEILQQISSFCNTNNIKYFLDYGTLLGCIRHNGFIPWDDDIDICMLRNDYEKFKSIFSSNDLSLISFETKGVYPLPFIKISDNRTEGVIYDKFKLNYGVAIDIFPIDDYPNNKIIRSLFFKIQDILMSLYGIALFGVYYKEMTLTTFIKKIFSKICSPSRICYLINKNAKIFNSDKAKYAGCVSEITKHKMEICLKESRKKQILHSFEKNEFYIPQGWDDVLTSIYGDDYMTPPPEGKRISTHVEAYYWKADIND